LFKAQFRSPAHLGRLPIIRRLTRYTLHDMLLGNLLRRYGKTAYVSTFAVLSALTVLAHYYAYFSWDLGAAHALQAIRLPGLPAFMRAVSLFGYLGVFDLMIAATVVVFLLLRWRGEAAALLLSAVGSQTIYRVLKQLVARPRPAPDLVTVYGDFHGRSFPSGHVTFYVCYFGFLFFVAYVRLPYGSVVRRVVQLTAALLIILIGPSRVYLGAHWPSDTIGSYLAGGLWLALSLYVYRRFKTDGTDEADESDAHLTASCCRDVPAP
jgi:membrane-associated phospholipid phosphatase